MFSSQYTKLAILSLTFAGVSGCTDQQVAIGVGMLGIGAGAAAVGIAASSAPSYAPPPPPRGHYACVGGGMRRSCNSYSNYRGYSQTTCRDVYVPCHQEWVSYLQSVDETGAASTDLLHADVSSSEWAQTFSMSQDSAELLVSALKQARDGDPSGLDEMGLGHGDLRSLGKLKMPSDAGLERMAQKLDQAPANTRAMVKTLIEQGAQLKANTCASGNGQDAAYAALCAQ